MNITFNLIKVKQLGTTISVARIDNWSLSKNTISTFADIQPITNLAISNDVSLTIAANHTLINQMYQDARGCKDKYVVITLNGGNSTFTQVVKTGATLISEGILGDGEHVSYPSTIPNVSIKGPALNESSIHRINSAEIFESL